MCGVTKHLTTLASALVLIGAVGFVSAVPASAQSKDETITVQDYPGTSNMLFRIAKAKGYCAAHRIMCQLKFIASGPLGVYLAAPYFDRPPLGPPRRHAARTISPRAAVSF